MTEDKVTAEFALPDGAAARKDIGRDMPVGEAGFAPRRMDLPKNLGFLVSFLLGCVYFSGNVWNEWILNIHDSFWKRIFLLWMSLECIIFLLVMKSVQ